MSDTYKIVISPQTISGDLFQVNYRGIEVGVYSAMTQLFSGGTGGTSLLTGMTIPILITQTAVDAGYYSPFDGAVLQKDVVANFLFSSTTTNPYVYYVYNTSDQFQKFLDLSVYTVDWGDNSPIQVISNYAPNSINHTYPTANASYTITMRQSNPWGDTIVKKEIQTPFTNIVPPNPQGTAYFIPRGGSWSATPISYDYIFSGDAVNVVSAQTSNNFLTVPFQISGTCKSRLTELQLYGPNLYELYTPVISNSQIWGNIFVTASTYTGYTIQGVDYYDYIDGTTSFFEDSSGFTKNNLTAQPITKNETLIKAVDQPQIQTDVYVERGKNSAYESIQRLGEVDNIGDMVNYGYGFFRVENKISAV